MTKENLLMILDNLDKPVSAIEKDLGMGAGILAKAKSGKRPLPEKWDAPLINYAEENKSGIIPMLKDSLEFPYYIPANQPELNKYGAPKLLTIPEVVVQKRKSVKIAGYELPIKEVAGMPENTFALVKRGTGSKFYEHNESWVKEIEEYCQNAGITPQVLIECHRHQNKAVVAKKQGKEEEITFRGNRGIIQSGGITQMSNQALAIRRKKLGLDDPK